MTVHDYLGKNLIFHLITDTKIPGIDRAKKDLGSITWCCKVTSYIGISSDLHLMKNLLALLTIGLVAINGCFMVVLFCFHSSCILNMTGFS